MDSLMIKRECCLVLIAIVSYLLAPPANHDSRKKKNAFSPSATMITLFPHFFSLIPVEFDTFLIYNPI
jgi:hypothetical protein